MSHYIDEEEDYKQETRRRKVASPAPEANTDAPEPARRQAPKSDQQRPRAKKKQPVDRRPGVVRFVTDKRLHGIIGVALILFSIYALIASISFISHGEADQSKVTNLSIDVMAQHANEIENTGGPFGASLAQTLIGNWFGVGSLVLIVYAIILGLALIKVKKCRFWALTLKTLILTIGLSILLGDVTFHNFSLGGMHGLAINNYLTSTMGEVGRYIMLLLTAAIMIFVFLHNVQTFVAACRRGIDKGKARRDEALKSHDVDEPAVNDNDIDNVDDTATAPDDTADTPATATAAGAATSVIADDDTEPIPAGDTITDFEALTNETERIFDESDDPEPSFIPDAEDTTAPAATFEINAPKIEEATEIKSVDPDEYDHRAELSRYRFPSLDLLIDRPVKTNIVDLDEQEENKARITKTLNDYQIAIQRIEATVGPTVTLYEIVPAEGVRIAKIKRLEDDIALSLAALGIRIIAPIPGKGTIGIEVPNKDPQTVSIRSILSSKKFQDCTYALPMAMGVTISNEVYIADLTKMPHLLVAGATGQGKSVGLNTIIASLLYKKHPSELKFVLIDPKMVEFSLYSKLERHYLAKLPDEEDAIITDPAKVVTTLNSLCVEMDQRYALLRDANVRSLAEYNAKFSARKLNPEKGHRYMPYIVMIVDEFADLIMTAGKEVETPIARIAQKARAVGMHMIIATQRPSTNVITGIIKANFPGRIAFRVQQMVDSKTILDRTGANQLIGRGDMLFSINGEMSRVQCAFIDTPEVVAICDSIDDQIGYEHAYFLPEFIPENDGSAGMNGVSDIDSLFEEAARAVVQSGVASTSSLQRRYSIGYNRAGKIMDQLEAAGIVGPAMGGKPRAILVDSLALERILESNMR